MIGWESVFVKQLLRIGPKYTIATPVIADIDIPADHQRIRDGTVDFKDHTLEILTCKPGTHGPFFAVPVRDEVGRIQSALANDVLEAPEDIVRRIGDGMGAFSAPP